MCNLDLMVFIGVHKGESVSKGEESIRKDIRFYLLLFELRVLMTSDSSSFCCDITVVAVSQTM